MTSTLARGVQRSRGFQLQASDFSDMENASFIALSRQMVLQRQMDLIANNIANINTPAYKGEKMVFVEYLAPVDPNATASAGGNTLSYVEDVAEVRDTSAGSFTPTGNTFDLAIHGSAYFVVDTPLGQRFTRNGRFSLDSSGKLVTSDGYAVLDSNDQPIVIPQDAINVQIAQDGTVTSGSAGAVPQVSNSLGQIKLVGFANEQALSKTGSGLYTTDQPPQPATGASVEQGMVEESNVQPVLEITRMIQTHRNYDNAENVINADNQMETDAIDKLTRTG